MNIYLETERLILRQLTINDEDDLFDLACDPKVVHFFKTDHVDRADIQSSLQKAIEYYEKRNGYGGWAVIEKSTQNFIGNFSFHPIGETPYFDSSLNHYDDIEIGYRFLNENCGKGYATEGSRALILKGFTELDTQCVTGATMSKNIGSYRVMEKLGMKLQTKFFYEKFGEEMVLYSLTKDEFMRENSNTI